MFLSRVTLHQDTLLYSIQNKQIQTEPQQKNLVFLQLFFQFVLQSVSWCLLLKGCKT